MRETINSTNKIYLPNETPLAMQSRKLKNYITNEAYNTCNPDIFSSTYYKESKTPTKKTTKNNVFSDKGRKSIPLYNTLPWSNNQKCPDSDFTFKEISILEPYEPEGEPEQKIVQEPSIKRVQRKGRHEISLLNLSDPEDLGECSPTKIVKHELEENQFIYVNFPLES